MAQKTFEELAITNRRRDHLHFTMIPNVIWFFDLSTSDFKLYNTIIKTTGADGASTCFKATQTLAREAGLSAGTVSKSKANLVRAGLITIKAKKRTKGGRPIDHIEIIDFWAENALFFKRVYSSDEKTPVFCSLDELIKRVYSPSELIGSLGETEEEPFNKNQKNEEKQPSPKTSKSNRDYLDLVLETKIAQDKLKHPITYLSELTADLLRLRKVPNYKFDELWESPLRDLLDQADDNIDHVEAALRTAVLEGQGSGITMTTPNSLHGLALKALAHGNEAEVRESNEPDRDDPEVQAWLVKKKAGELAY